MVTMSRAATDSTPATASAMVTMSKAAMDSTPATASVMVSTSQPFYHFIFSPCLNFLPKYSVQIYCI